MTGQACEEENIQEPPRKKRIRSAVACDRCKERRQKCDNASPACSNCFKAGKSCEFTGNEYPSWYVRALEERVGILESRLRSSSEPSHPSNPLNAASTSSDTPPPPLSSATTTSHPGSSSNHLGVALGFLSLAATAEPYYIGSSSGFSLANMVHAAVFPHAPIPQTPNTNTMESSASPPTTLTADSSTLNLPSPEDRPFTCHVPKPTTQPAQLPSDEIGDALLLAYLSKVHQSYPFLDRSRLIISHLDRHTTLADRDRPLQLEHKMALIKLHLVYGIGSRHLQLSSTNSGQFDKSLPEAHFVAAVQLLETAFELRSMDNIETMLLLALYSLHSPSGPGAWHLLGMAMRLSLELGLHRQVRHLPPGMKHADQLRKRLFWSVYMLERKVSITLGRPFSISDHDIDVDLPLDLDGGIGCIPIPSLDPDSPFSGGTDTSHHIKLIRLQRIVSKIQTITSRVDTPSVPMSENLERMRYELELWRTSVQTMPSQPHLKEALLLEHHKAVRLLLQPFILQPVPAHDHILACAFASGAICQSYKRLHQAKPAGMYLVELHDILIAGITLIYCLWLDTNLIDPYATANDLGACSTVLFVIAERWASAKNYRDAFECLVRKTMDHLRMRHAQVAGSNATEPPERMPIDTRDFDYSILGTSVLRGGMGEDVWSMLNEMTGEKATMGMEGNFSWMNGAITDNAACMPAFL